MTKFKRLIRRRTALLITILLVLSIGIGGTVSATSLLLGWPEEGTFSFAVGKDGNTRLLSPDIKGKHATKLKKDEVLIELPSKQLFTELENRVTEFINNINSQLDAVSQIEGPPGPQGSQGEQGPPGPEGPPGDTEALQQRIIALEERVSALEANSGGSSEIIQDDLILWLPMNEGSGTIANDASGSGNNGVINSANWIPIDSGYALNMPGHSKVNCGNGTTLASTFSGQEPFTIELWFKLTSTPTSNGIFTSKWSSDNAHGFMFRIYTSRVINFHIREGSHTLYAFGPEPATLNEWHHLVVSMDGSVITIYLDTVAGSSLGNTISLDSNDGDFIIGKWHGFHLDGLVDEVRVYNKALSPAEILHNYQTQASNYTP